MCFSDFAVATEAAMLKQKECSTLPYMRLVQTSLCLQLTSYISYILTELCQFTLLYLQHCGETMALFSSLGKAFLSKNTVFFY